MRAFVPFSLQPGDWMTVSFGRYAGIDGQVLEVQEVPPLVVRARLRVGFDEDYWQPVWKEPMTEAEWLTTRDTAAMERFLFALPTPPSERKWRLLGGACARQVISRVPTRMFATAMEWIEYCTDNPGATTKTLELLRDDLEQRLGGPGFGLWRIGNVSRLLQLLLTSDCPRPNWPGDVRRIVGQIAKPHSSADAQRQLLRDIMGNPFRQAIIEPLCLTWQDGQIVRLAELIYNEQQWNDLPILADALEDAGCTDETILSHCRNPGLHARGCWLLDGLLCKQ
jgi:hypothetical protein